MRLVGNVGAALVIACSTLGGCGPRAVVNDPGSITLKSALAEVGEGLAQMVKAQPPTNNFGLYPAEVTVTFNVIATGTSSASLMVTPGSRFITPAIERAGAQVGVGESASRGNTVSVKFVNLLFAPQDSLVHHVSGTQLFELRQAILGIDPRPVFIAVPPDPVAREGAAPAPNTGGEPPKPPADSSKEPAPQAAAAPHPSLPAMKFLSPFTPEQDPAELIRALSVERLRDLARAINTKVGLTVVDPHQPEADLRRAVGAAAIKDKLNKAAIESMIASSAPKP
jgi:hypothetical protein